MSGLAFFLQFGDGLFNGIFFHILFVLHPVDKTLYELGRIIFLLRLLVNAVNRLQCRLVKSLVLEVAYVHPFLIVGISYSEAERWGRGFAPGKTVHVEDGGKGNGGKNRQEK